MNSVAAAGLLEVFLDLLEPLTAQDAAAEQQAAALALGLNFFGFEAQAPHRDGQSQASLHRNKFYTQTLFTAKNHVVWLLLTQQTTQRKADILRVSGRCREHTQAPSRRRAPHCLLRYEIV